MSPQNALAAQTQNAEAPKNSNVRSEELQTPSVLDLLTDVRSLIAPVWPLKDYVAVNPYKGFADLEFLAAREYLRKVSDVEFFMPVDYYREQYAAGQLTRVHTDAAVDELVADGVPGAERIDVNQVQAYLEEACNPGPTSDSQFLTRPNSDRRLYTALESLDKVQLGQPREGAWTRLIVEEVSKHCSSHYDDGQAIWKGTTQSESLFGYWRSAMRFDRSFELAGVENFRNFAGQLPKKPHVAVRHLLARLGLPAELWKEYLLCMSLGLPGWSAWASYQDHSAEEGEGHGEEFTSLLAIRLAYEVALVEHLEFENDWTDSLERLKNRDKAPAGVAHDDLLQYALLRASEIAFRNRLLSNICDTEMAHLDSETTTNRKDTSEESPTRRLAQLIFCIDVRSERYRRHLEANSASIETFGFAGFFGVPMEFVELGESEGTSNCPVLISPQFSIHESLEDEKLDAQSIKQRTTARRIRKSWRSFQKTAASMFGFVEAIGLGYSVQLLARSLGTKMGSALRLDSTKHTCNSRLPLSLNGLEAQGVSQEAQVNMAESILRGIGIIENFANLVVFSGHGSQVENNPLKAGLDCGACGGHSGEPNARFAAKLLNQPFVREQLKQRGIEIPDDTLFVAALHNTTTDQLTFFDLEPAAESHSAEIEELQAITIEAAKGTRQERLAALPGSNESDLDRRSQDWSEVRPEWGLAGNAAFIVAPREFTNHFSLAGRAFLHSYDHEQDADFAVLEQIMTAPMVVANWINMQYFASTVDPIHFGSGNKAVHNVVGGFGVLSGNGGDLQTGLPWQSIHDGERYQHHPLRLLVVIAAPREAIQDILTKHDNVRQLLCNGWLQLVAHDANKFHRFTEKAGWEEISAEHTRFESKPFGL